MTQEHKAVSMHLRVSKHTDQITALNEDMKLRLKIQITSDYGH